MVKIELVPGLGIDVDSAIFPSQHPGCGDLPGLVVQEGVVLGQIGLASICKGSNCIGICIYGNGLEHVHKFTV